MSTAFIVGCCAAIGGWLGYEYIHQDGVKKKAFAMAEEHAGEKGILNIGAGVMRSSTAYKVATSPHVRVNVDVSCTGTPNCMVWNANTKLPFKDREFGVAHYSHVVEHLHQPILAIEEGLRVADMVIVVLPPPWGLSNRLHRDHKHLWSKADMNQLRATYPRLKVFS